MDFNVKLVKKFRCFVVKKNCIVVQLVLVWFFKQGEDIILILGMKKMKYLEENWGVFQVFFLDEEEVEIWEFVDMIGFFGFVVLLQFMVYFYCDIVEEKQRFMFFSFRYLSNSFYLDNQQFIKVFVYFFYLRDWYFVNNFSNYFFMELYVFKYFILFF